MSQNVIIYVLGQNSGSGMRAHSNQAMACRFVSVVSRDHYVLLQTQRLAAVTEKQA